MISADKIPWIRLLVAPLFTGEIACRLVDTSELINSKAKDQNTHLNLSSRAKFILLHRDPL